MALGFFVSLATIKLYHIPKPLKKFKVVCVVVVGCLPHAYIISYHKKYGFFVGDGGRKNHRFCRFLAVGL